MLDDSTRARFMGPPRALEGQPLVWRPCGDGRAVGACPQVDAPVEPSTCRSGIEKPSRACVPPASLRRTTNPPQEDHVWISRRIRRLAVANALATVGLVLLAGPAQAAAVIARWNMGDTGSTMSDASGRGHTGKLHSVKVQQAGASGKGFGFSGSPSYVSVPASGDFKPGTGAFRIQLSVRLTSRPSASVIDYDLLRMGQASSSGGDYKVEILKNGKAFCHFRGSSGTGDVTGGPDLSDGHWHTITCARTASTVVLTVDGSSYSTSRKTGSITSSQTLYIGAKDSGGADQYTGLMDSVSISKG